MGNILSFVINISGMLIGSYGVYLHYEKKQKDKQAGEFVSLLSNVGTDELPITSVKGLVNNNQGNGQGNGQDNNPNNSEDSIVRQMIGIRRIVEAILSDYLKSQNSGNADENGEFISSQFKDPNGAYEALTKFVFDTVQNSSGEELNRLAYVLAMKRSTENDINPGIKGPDKPIPVFQVEEVENSSLHVSMAGDTYTYQPQERNKMTFTNKLCKFDFNKPIDQQDSTNVSSNEKFSVIRQEVDSDQSQSQDKLIVEESFGKVNRTISGFNSFPLESNKNLHTTTKVVNYNNNNINQNGVPDSINRIHEYSAFVRDTPNNSGPAQRAPVPDYPYLLYAEKHITNSSNESPLDEPYTKRAGMCLELGDKIHPSLVASKHVTTGEFDIAGGVTIQNDNGSTEHEFTVSFDTYTNLKKLYDVYDELKNIQGSKPLAKIYIFNRSNPSKVAPMPPGFPNPQAVKDRIENEKTFICAGRLTDIVHSGTKGESATVKFELEDIGGGGNGKKEDVDKIKNIMAGLTDPLSGNYFYVIADVSTCFEIIAKLTGAIKDLNTRLSKLETPRPQPQLQ